MLSRAAGRDVACESCDIDVAAVGGLIGTGLPSIGPRETYSDGES